jgi:hypothetical protein
VRRVRHAILMDIVERLDIRRAAFNRTQRAA